MNNTAPVTAEKLKSGHVLVADDGSARTIVGASTVGGTTWVSFTKGRDEPMPNDVEVRIRSEE